MIATSFVQDSWWMKFEWRDLAVLTVSEEH